MIAYVANGRPAYAVGCMIAGGALALDWWHAAGRVPWSRSVTQAARARTIVWCLYRLPADGRDSRCQRARRHLDRHAVIGKNRGGAGAVSLSGGRCAGDHARGSADPVRLCVDGGLRAIC